MNTVINAFHPDFMKTYYPNFTKEFRTVEANREHRIATHVKVKRKKAKPKVNYKVPKQVIVARRDRPRSERLEEIKKNILGVREYHTFARAGMPKGFNFEKGQKKHGTNT
jgi:hypothetical protein